MNNHVKSEMLSNRHTDTQTKYCNPRCACVPRVNKALKICLVSSILVSCVLTNSIFFSLSFRIQLSCSLSNCNFPAWNLSLFFFRTLFIICPCICSDLFLTFPELCTYINVSGIEGLSKHHHYFSDLMTNSFSSWLDSTPHSFSCQETSIFLIHYFSQ